MSSISDYHPHQAHTDTQMPTDTPLVAQTVRHWCAHFGKKQASTMTTVRRRYGKGLSLDSVLTDEQVSVIFGTDTHRKVERQHRRPKPDKSPTPVPTPEPQPASAGFDMSALRSITFDVTCISIVVGHAALIWYDCASQWGTPGLIGGSIAFLIVMAALLVSTDSSRVRTSQSALWFVFVVDAAAWNVHYPTFRQYADIGDIQTGAFAAFLCLFSWVALYLYRDSKID